MSGPFGLGRNLNLEASVDWEKVDPGSLPASHKERLSWPGGTDLSVGVELEFIILWRHDESTKVPPPPAWVLSPEDEAAYPVVYRFREGQDAAPISEWVFSVLCKRMLELGFRIAGKKERMSIPVPGFYLTPDGAWEVKTDGTVQEQEFEYNTFAEYCSEGVEITSPPMRDCPETYEHIRDFVRALLTNFRLRVNKTCGLHVHLGNGVKGVDEYLSFGAQKIIYGRAFSADDLRRSAGLLWAAGGFFDRLHPIDRETNWHCEPITRCSRLGVGDPSQTPYVPPPGPEQFREGLPRYSNARLSSVRDTFDLPNAPDPDKIPSIAAA